MLSQVFSLVVGLGVGTAVGYASNSTYEECYNMLHDQEAIISLSVEQTHNLCSKLPRATADDKPPAADQLKEAAEEALNQTAKDVAEKVGDVVNSPEGKAAKEYMDNTLKNLGF